MNSARNLKKQWNVSTTVLILVSICFERFVHFLKKIFSHAKSFESGKSFEWD